MIDSLVNLNLINIDLKSTNKDDVFIELAQALVDDFRIQDIDIFLKSVHEREASCITTMEGIAYPHCKSLTVASPAISIGIAPTGIEYGQDDDEPQPKVFFMIASPVDSNLHIEVLKLLFSKFSDGFVDDLCSATSKQDVLTILKKD